MRSLMCYAVVVLLVALAAGPATAKDVYADQVWFRGDENTTYQHWEFTTDQQTDILPETYMNPYPPPPECDIIANNAEWKSDWEAPVALLDDPTDPGIPGWHCPEGAIMIHILHNNPVPNASKIIIAQVTATKEPVSVSLELPTGITYQMLDVSAIMPTVIWGQPAPFSETGAEWATYVYAFETSLNPEWESIVIEYPPCTTLDQMVVDSICIPEPATIGLLALGLAGLVRRRR